MCVSSNSNITIPCKICNTNIKNTDIAAQCDICQFWIHMKCNNLNHIDYKYLQGSNDPWFCISYCNEIFPFGTLGNKNFLSMMMVNSSPTAINPLSTNLRKWSNTLKQLVGNLPMNCLSVFDHFVELALKGLKTMLMLLISIVTL